MRVPRIVLDTNTLVSALLFSQGRRSRLRHAWQAGRFTPLISRETAQELLRVLSYPKFEPSGDELDLAILYGSVAKQSDQADSDIDVLLVSDSLTLEDVFSVLASTESELGRAINPTLYTRDEFRRRRESDNSFLCRILAGPHLTLKGSTDE